MAIIRKSSQASQEREVGIIEQKEFTRTVNGEEVVVFVASRYRPEKGRDVIYLELWNGKFGRAAWNQLKNHVRKENEDDEVVFDD